MADQALRGNKLTRIGFKHGGAYGPLRGTTAGGVAKAFRGPSGFKESQALQKKLKPHITETRTIGTTKAPVSYTKSRWKNWKKTKSQQYKRKEAQREKPLPPKLQKLVPKLQRAFPHHGATGKLIKGNK